MDDKFLYQLREAPDAEFASALHKNLSENRSEPEQQPLTNHFGLPRIRRLIQVAAFLLISLLAILAISPARAVVSSLISNIAGQLFEVTEDYPGDNDPGGEEIIEPQVMPLGNALAIFPYEIKLPTDIPSNYIFQDYVHVYVGEAGGPFSNTIVFEWISPEDHSYLNLRVTDTYASVSEVVAPDSIEEVLLDANHPAVLIRGGWDVDKKVWNNDYGYRLRWTLDNLTYDLMGVNREQLIKIAISTLK